MSKMIQETILRIQGEPLSNSATIPSGPGERPVRSERRTMFNSPILKEEPHSVGGGGSIGMSPNSSGAFHIFSERYSAKVVALMCFEVSLPWIL